MATRARRRRPDLSLGPPRPRRGSEAESSIARKIFHSSVGGGFTAAVALSAASVSRIRRTTAVNAAAVPESAVSSRFSMRLRSISATASIAYGYARSTRSARHGCVPVTTGHLLRPAAPGAVAPRLRCAHGPGTPPGYDRAWIDLRGGLGAPALCQPACLDFAALRRADWILAIFDAKTGTLPVRRSRFDGPGLFAVRCGGDTDAHRTA